MSQITYTTTATATYATGNKVQVASTTNMFSGLPIAFSGNVFGGITQGTTYYIGNIIIGYPTSNITLNTTPGGSGFGLANATGNMTATFSQGGQQIIPTVAPGEPLNQAFNAVNVNFDQVFAAGPVGTNVQIVNNTILTTNTNGNLVLAPNGIGVVQSNVSIVPNTANIRNLGSATNRWATIYGQYLNISGTSTLSNVNISGGTITLPVANLHIAGGTNGYVLQTDGTGNLTWTAQTGGSGNATPAGANTQVQFNDSGSFGGAAGFTFNKTSNALAVGGNITGGNILTNGIVSAAGNVVSGNIFGNAITLRNTDDYAQIVFSNDGGATNNGQIKVDGGTNMVISSNNNFYVKRNGQDRIAVTDTTADFMAATNVRIQSNKTGTANTWIFDTTGNLTLPSNSANINYSNGVSILAGVGSSYGDSNVVALLGDFGSNSISTTGGITVGQIDVGANLYIGTGPGGGTFILANANIGLISLSEGANGGSYVGWTENLLAPGNIAQISFNPNGNSQGNVVVSTGSTDAPFNWTFDNTGNLTMPGNTFAVNYADGTPVSLGGTTTWANITDINNLNGPTNITIGFRTGNNQGANSVAVGDSAGSESQGQYSVAVGPYSGQDNQHDFAVAIGYSAAYDQQGNNAIAIGNYAGGETQGDNAIAIGYYAAYSNQPANSIVLNGSGDTYSQAPTNSGFYVNPVRNDTGNVGNAVYFNSTTNELTYGPAGGNTGNFVFDSYDLDSTTFDEITIGEGSSGNILINAPSLAMVLAGGDSDGMVAGNGNVYVFNGDPTFVDGIPQPGVGYTWQFDNNGNLNLPQGGWIGAATGKGFGTMLTGGRGNLASLTSYYADTDFYSSCVTVNADGTLNITTYGNGTGQLGQWNFADTTLNVPGNGTITTAQATGGLGGNSITITAGAADQGSYSTNPGGNLTLQGGLGAFNDGGGGGPGGSVNITAGLSSDPAGHAGNVTVNSGTNTWNFDYTGQVSLPGGTGYISSSANNIAIYSDAAETNGILFYDGGSEVYSSGNFAIFADNAGDGNIWRFYGNSVMTTPGNIVTPGILTDGYYYANGTPVTFGGGGTYGDSNVVSLLSSFGSNTIYTSGSITGGNINSGHIVIDSANSTITTDNGQAVLVGRPINATGNISSTGNVLASDAVIASGNVSGANIFTSGQVSAAGNITAANFIGNISITGNVTGTSPNVQLVAGSYTYTFDNTGNVTLPAGGDLVFSSNTTLTSISNGNITVDPNGTGQLLVTATTPVQFGNTLSVAGNVTVSGTGGVKIPNLPAFRVYGNGVTNGLNVTTNGTGILNGNNWAVDYNQGNVINSTTGYFTAPVAGLYQVNLVARCANNVAPSSQAIVIKNYGTANVNQVMWEVAANTTVNHFGVSTVSKLAVGDTLVLKVTLGNISFDVNDNWSVVFLG